MRSNNTYSLLRKQPAASASLSCRYAAFGIVLVLASCSASQPTSQYAVHFSQGAERGFQIQVYSTQNRDEAESVMSAANVWWNQLDDQQRRNIFGVDYLPMDLKWLEPNFKVRLGHFRTREDAREVLQHIAQQFPAAFIVPDTLL